MRSQVLQLGKFYPPHMGGIEIHLQALCQELRHHVDLEVAVANDGPQTQHDVVNGVSVKRCGTKWNFAAAPLCPGMVSTLRNSEAQLVHIHLPNPMAVIACLAGGLRRKRLVVTYHSDTVRQKALGAAFQPLLDAVLRRADRIVVTSPDYLRSSTTLARYKSQCEVIPYGIPVNDFAAADPTEVSAIRAQYGPRIVISVGRLVYYKGFEYLIRAMRDVEGLLLIAGDGPLRGKLEQLVISLDLTNRVTFLGEIQNHAIVPFYHAADVFALASVARSEAFGIVQAEAMAAGRPVINTSLDSGVPFVSIDGVSGITVPPADPAALASALNRLLGDTELRQRYSAGARNRARSEFELAVMMRRVFRLYDDVLTGREAAQESLVHAERNN